MSEISTATEQLEPRKAALRDYFGPAGFERWKSIYGDGPVSFIRRSVREGHAAVLQQAVKWLEETAAGRKLYILDAGCGPGLVSLSLAEQGHRVVGCDLAPQMVEAAREKLSAEPSDIRNRTEFVCSDLEKLTEKFPPGSFQMAVCLDVLIYYPEEELAKIIAELKVLAPGGLIFTYAPANWVFKAMHWLGKRFPHRHRATRLEIIGEKAVRRALAANGWQLRRQRHFSKGFYHVVLAEAV